jgi:hypothetical protein
MKKLFLLSISLLLFSCTAVAQNDFFALNPPKKSVRLIKNKFIVTDTCKLPTCWAFGNTDLRQIYNAIKLQGKNAASGGTSLRQSTQDSIKKGLYTLGYMQKLYRQDSATKEFNKVNVGLDAISAEVDVSNQYFSNFNSSVFGDGGSNSIYTKLRDMMSDYVGAPFPYWINDIDGVLRNYQPQILGNVAGSFQGQTESFAQLSVFKNSTNNQSVFKNRNTQASVFIDTINFISLGNYAKYQKDFNDSVFLDISGRSVFTPNGVSAKSYLKNTGLTDTLIANTTSMASLVTAVNLFYAQHPNRQIKDVQYTNAIVVGTLNFFAVIRYED